MRLERTRSDSGQRSRNGARGDTRSRQWRACTVVAEGGSGSTGDREDRGGDKGRSKSAGGVTMKQTGGRVGKEPTGLYLRGNGLREHCQTSLR